MDSHCSRMGRRAKVSAHHLPRQAPGGAGRAGAGRHTWAGCATMCGFRGEGGQLSPAFLLEKLRRGRVSTSAPQQGSRECRFHCILTGTSGALISKNVASPWVEQMGYLYFGLPRPAEVPCGLPGGRARPVPVLTHLSRGAFCRAGGSRAAGHRAQTRPGWSSCRH